MVSSQIKYYDAAQFPLLGKITDSTETRYERLPTYLKEKSRTRLWSLGKNTSGLAVRFRSNSTTISARWVVLEDVKMNHMTETGIKGLDLYSWENNHWQFVNSGRPTGKLNEQKIIGYMPAKEREYLLFLPLYDGVTSLSIGVDSTSVIQAPKLPYPSSAHPIVVYGTSITQGGCATRPGMSYTNILTRKLNREFINLGFSGNGQLDYEIAEIIAKRTDVALFILDFIPNVNENQIKEKTASFFHILRKNNPNTPVIFVETILFPHAFYDKAMCATINGKNNLLRREYEKLKKDGQKNIYYLSADNLIGKDGEATVDGIHLTDLGFLRFSEKLKQSIEKIVPL